MSEPTGTLDTPIGTVRYVMTQADHVYLRTESSLGEVITIRGIPYHLGFHCHLVDGQWTATDFHEPYLSRTDHILKDASSAARATARGILSKAWTDHLAAHPGLTRQAALAKAHAEVDRLADEVADLEAKYTAKVAELKTAKKTLAAS